MRKLWSLLGSVLLTGCATLSEEECRYADWQQLGYTDGSAGHSPARLDEHREACAEYAIVPDMELYLTGREQGVRVYCQPDNGFVVGRSGGSISVACPTDLRAAFVENHSAGRQLWLQKQSLKREQDRLNTLKRELADERKKKEKLENKLIAKGSSESDRRTYLQELRVIDTELYSLQRQISDAERHVAKEQLKYDQLDAKLTAQRLR